LNRKILLLLSLVAVIAAATVAAGASNSRVLYRGYVALFDGRVHLGQVAIHSSFRVCDVGASHWSKVEWLGQSEDLHKFKITDRSKKIHQCESKTTVCLDMIVDRKVRHFCTLPLNAKPVGENTDRMQRIILY
jgi:hypothetical protein